MPNEEYLSIIWHRPPCGRIFLTDHPAFYLDQDMPVRRDSSLPFEKVAEREYVYTSDTLPEENLLHYHWTKTASQNFIST